MYRTVVLFVCVVTTAVGLRSIAKAQVKETYVFRDSLLPTEGAGNALEPVYNGTGTILTSGTGFVNGTFVTENISASACASSPSVRAWSFPVSGGLRHANVAPAVVTGSYSISMLMRYHPMDTGYARLVDFSNSASDSGIYKLNDGVSFYPVGTYAAGSFVDNQDVFVTITRDATSQLVSLYINGVASGTYTDTGNLYAPSASALYFLMDNTTGSAAINETDAGVIAYLQVRDAPMTPTEVTASLAAICNTVACGDGSVGTGEECDDGGVVAGDGCSSTCTVEAGWVCSGGPSVCTLLCGNGVLNSGETCDDGGRSSGDGCSASCAVETGYFCTGAPSVCAAWTTCTASNYESAAPTATTDRVCTACTVCGTGMVQMTACSAMADTVCGQAMDGDDAGQLDAGKPDAGKPDAGKLDAGKLDAGKLDAGKPDAGKMPGTQKIPLQVPDAGKPDAGKRTTGLDASGGDHASTADASTAPPSKSTGGCGCVVAGSSHRSGAAGLASMILLGLVGARRARRRATRT
jgi:cysteine-rich repeat protein